MITHEQLALLTTEPDKWLLPITQAAEFYDIDTPNREAMFLAQCAHESAGFTRLVENLNYSPQALLRTWPARFSPELAVAMAHDATRIAERVYGGRLGNDIEGSGDGYAYRGRGLIQLTGRGNYRKCGGELGIPLETSPDMVLDPHVAALTAAWFWSQAGCNALADSGNFAAITKRINGGTNGQADREALLAKLGPAAGNSAA